MREHKHFDEMVELYLAGNVDLYANPIVTACVPQGTYLELLGVGGEKLVISYMDTLTKQKRVLNIRLPSLTTQGERRFIRGARILMKIISGEMAKGRVPPFPFVYEVRETPPYYVTEFIKGGSLRDYIQSQESLALTDRLLLIKDLAQGLYLMHSYGIVHRDVKPDNVIVTESGKPKWIDFGIAMSQYENALTRTDARLGTPDYAAPEQMIDAGRVDHRADIYAFAKVVYFIMVGDEEYDAASLPVELMLCIPRAWQYDVDRRQSDIMEFLREIAEGYPNLDLLGESYEVPADFTPAQALIDLIVLFGGNPGKVKKILRLNMSQWESLMDQAKRLVIHNS